MTTTAATTATAEDVRASAVRAKQAAAVLAPMCRADKDRALLAMADGLDANTEKILAANGEDVSAAREAGTAPAMVDRLTLTAARLAGMSGGLRQIAALGDPVGEVVHGKTLPNGMELRQVRVPLGVVGIIYEARPNVTVDAAGLCLKSGNAVLLRGSGSAIHSNAALVDVLRDAVTGADLPADAIQLVPGVDRESVNYLMRLRGLVDVLIPRGGAGLIRTVVEGSAVPVLETGVGNCHVYVDADADLDQAVSITLNAKTQRVSVCNAAETLLVHRDIASVFLPRVLGAFRGAGVVVHGDETVCQTDTAAVPATDDDWATEYLSMDIAVRVVDGLDDAVTHIRRWGSGHTEAIVTRSLAAARRFVAACDSAAVMVNASTRFTDGERFGFGAEVGISTQKLHARGPMGLAALTSTTWVGIGDGHLVT